MSKRILYIAENAISPIQGGGIVVYALLRGARAEDLLCFYSYPNITPAPEYQDRSHHIGNYRSLFGRAGRPHQFRPNLNPPHLSRPRTKGLKAKALFSLAHLADRVTRLDLRMVLEQVDNDGFRPEVIFAAPLSLRTLRLARLCAEHFGIPVVILNMDDWPASEAYHMWPLTPLWAAAIRTEMRRIAPCTVKALSNSPHLCAQLERRYGLAHETVNNACYDLLGGQQPPAPDNSPEKPRVLVFSGALNWHLQGESLVLFSYAVAELALRRNVQLRIYAPWEFAPIANQIAIPGKVIYAGFVPKSELAARYLEADFLVASTTFDDNEIHLFRQSLATKLSDYLCMGRPVISVGHPDWAVHDYVDTHDCGIAIRSPNLAHIKQALDAALDWPEQRRLDIGRRNRALWESAHDICVMGRPARELLGLGNVPPEA